jgi:hypothetical protein
MAADKTESLPRVIPTSSAICSSVGNVGSRSSIDGSVANGATDRGTIPHLQAWVSAEETIMSLT